jgi:penicillin amidase
MRQGRRLTRIHLLLIVVAALAAVVTAAWWWARGSLPLLDGEQAVDGLTGPVEVLFDAHGVPHVYASGPEDAWLAAGLLHARDRFWQMELYRRVSAGRLSEIFGERTLPIDRRFLTLGLRRAAADEWAAASPPTRQALMRYAAGVNAYLAQARGRRRPLELQILGIDPEPWTPIDSLAVGRLLAWRLAENHQAELVRHALSERFGLHEAMRLGGEYPESGPTVMPDDLEDGGALEESDTPQAISTGPQTTSAEGLEMLGRRVAASDTSRERWPHGLEWLLPGVRRGGSNNWVIGGQRTATGRPLLANDPHLQLEFPGVWYEMHLVAAGLDVIGVTIPGAPFVILGHNARIAWGMTNSGVDVQDLFVERVDLGRRRYLDDGRWVPVEVTRADIPVRGREPEPFEVWRTRHGALFAEVGLDWEDVPAWLAPSANREGERRVFALRWPQQGETAGAFERLNRASSWDEFVAAIETFGAPSQNIVYADVDGNIGYILSGAVPRRSGGAVPRDGTRGGDGAIDWIPPGSLPRVLNPARGYVSSSNNLIDRRWGNVLTRDWAAPYRAMRIQRLIESAGRVSLDMAASWQTDLTGLAAADVLEHVDAALAAAGRQHAQEAAGALSLLRAWDRQIDGRPIVTLYQLFEDALWRRTFADEMGEPLFSRFYEWAGAERPAGLYAILDEPRARWWDDIGTIETREGRDDIYVLAAADAARRLRDEIGEDAAWDQVHAARFAHPLGAAAVPMAWLFDRGPVPVAGDGFTVNRSSYHRLRPFAAWEVPSWRQIVDVGRWDESRVVAPAGQSGHPLSPHYFDQNQMWRRGQYRRQPFSRAAVEAAAKHRLLLVPAASVPDGERPGDAGASGPR